MTVSKRRKIIAGNWKMFTDATEGAALAEDIISSAGGLTDHVDLVLCPPFPGLDAVSKILLDSRIALGGQNMHWAVDGAYTGEVSARMLLTSGCRYVILGHSERRTYFGETDIIVNKKVKSALDAGLHPIVCVGETDEERETGQTEPVITDQIRGGLAGLKPIDIENLVLAYEPVWAIGTGKTATPDQANEVHVHIRQVITDLFGQEAGESIRIQYGGSVKPENAAKLLSESDIDGALVGGASLDAASFVAISRAADSPE